MEKNNDNNEAQELLAEVKRLNQQLQQMAASQKSIKFWVTVIGIPVWIALVLAALAALLTIMAAGM